ncbi:MAG: hypothetical protein J7M18_02925 [Candidatus Eremiobacteraeota bacterium]|nr:hypothetical protein [Candidatus Eremiobacteraeota bacterium]
MKINRMGREGKVPPVLEIQQRPEPKEKGSVQKIKDSVSLSKPRPSRSSPDKLPKDVKSTKINLPKDIPPYGTVEMYQPYLIMSGKKTLSKGERLAPVKINFDGDWNVLNNKENYKENYFGHDKVKEVSEKMGTVYTHEMFAKIGGEKYKIYQYWYYWAENPFYIDQHEHDIQYVQVYVKENGQPKWVFTNSHMDLIPYLAHGKEEPEEGQNIIYRPWEVKWKGTHPIVYVAQNSHALVANKRDFRFYDRCNEPYVFEGLMPNMVSLDDPKNLDNPFPGYEDKHGILDKKGNMKHHGFFQNPFVKVRGITRRKAFKKGAHTIFTIFGHNVNKFLR